MRSSNQKERLQKLKQGEGTFVYEGGAHDTESIPGIPYIGKDGNQARSVIFTTVEDADGKKVQIVDPKASEKGELVWKRAPQFKRIEIEVYKIPAVGVMAEHTEINDDGSRKPSLTAKPDANGKVRALFLEFPKGQPVFVSDPRTALKLRCLSFFKEVESDKHDAKPAKMSEAEPKAKAESKPAKA